MKTILYLDKIMLDSFLAQIEHGLTSKYIKETSNDSTKSRQVGVKLGLSELIKTFISADAEIGFLKSDTESIMESREIFYHDYALEQLLHHIDMDKELPFILAEGPLQIYDFARLESIGSGRFSDILSGTDKNSVFSNLYQVGVMGNTLFPNSYLVRISNYICICPKENFRVNESVRPFLNKVERKVKCLAVILYERKDLYGRDSVEDKPLKILEDGSWQKVEINELLANAPIVFIDPLLYTFDLSEKYDIVIHPIAIYYEN